MNVLFAFPAGSPKKPENLRINEPLYITAVWDQIAIGTDDVGRCRRMYFRDPWISSFQKSFDTGGIRGQNVVLASMTPKKSRLYLLSYYTTSTFIKSLSQGRGSAPFCRTSYRSEKSFYARSTSKSKSRGSLDSWSIILSMKVLSRDKGITAPSLTDSPRPTVHRVPYLIERRATTKPNSICSVIFLSSFRAATADRQVESYEALYVLPALLMILIYILLYIATATAAITLTLWAYGRRRGWKNGRRPTLWKETLRSAWRGNKCPWAFLWRHLTTYITSRWTAATAAC